MVPGCPTRLWLGGSLLLTLEFQRDVDQLFRVPAEELELGLPSLYELGTHAPGAIAADLYLLLTDCFSTCRPHMSARLVSKFFRITANVKPRGTVVPAMTEISQQSSRQRILEAAFELMSENGYAGTSMSMLTKRSGLRPSSTYWHFGSKEELLVEVVEYSASRWLTSLPRWGDLEGSPNERLHKLLRTAQDGIHEPFLRLLLLLALEQARSGGAWLDTIRRVRRSAASGFRKAFDEIVGVPADEEMRCRRDELAGFALAAVDGIFMATQIDECVDVSRMFALLEYSFLALCNSESLQANYGRSR